MKDVVGHVGCQDPEVLILILLVEDYRQLGAARRAKNLAYRITNTLARSRGAEVDLAVGAVQTPLMAGSPTVPFNDTSAALRRALGTMDLVEPASYVAKPSVTTAELATTNFREFIFHALR